MSYVAKGEMFLFIVLNSLETVVVLLMTTMKMVVVMMMMMVGVGRTENILTAFIFPKLAQLPVVP